MNLILKGYWMRKTKWVPTTYVTTSKKHQLTDSVTTPRVPLPFVLGSKLNPTSVTGCTWTTQNTAPIASATFSPWLWQPLFRGKEGNFFAYIYVTLIRHARSIVEETAAKNEFSKIYGRRKLLERTCGKIKRFTYPLKTRRRRDRFLISQAQFKKNDVADNGNKWKIKIVNFVFQQRPTRLFTHK